MVEENILEENGSKQEFRCEKCGKTFPEKLNLGAHIRRYHKGVLPCPLEGCKKAYKHRSVKPPFYKNLQLVQLTTKPGFELEAELEAEPEADLEAELEAEPEAVLEDQL